MNAAAIAHEQRTSTWQNDTSRAPVVKSDDLIMYDEPGRIIYRTSENKPGEGVDYRSHWYRMIKPRFGPWTLLVRHGGGDERVELGYDYNNFPAIFDPLTSNARYLLMNQLMLTHRAGRDEGRTKTADLYRTAFAEGRLKKRKIRWQAAVKVWIEEPKNPA